MIKVLIIEDEEPAAERLHQMLQSIDPLIKIMDSLVSVSSSVKWFNKNPAPDLIFMDVNLADGSSFEIFKKVEIKTPVIFTTAYDQFALDAFKVNSVDYLLKPLKKDALARAIDKFKTHFTSPDSAAADYSKLVDLLAADRKNFQQRILIRYGETIKAVNISQVAYFYTEEKFNFLVTFDNFSYPLDMNLDEAEHKLDPSVFFRINRQFIINVNSIDKMVAYSKSRVKLVLNPPSHLETIVSTDRSPTFKAWLTGNDHKEE